MIHALPKISVVHQNPGLAFAKPGLSAFHPSARSVADRDEAPALAIGRHHQTFDVVAFRAGSVGIGGGVEADTDPAIPTVVTVVVVAVPAVGGSGGRDESGGSEGNGGAGGENELAEHGGLSC